MSEPDVSELRRSELVDRVLRVVWLEDPTQYEYLREGAVGTTRRTGRPAIPRGGHLVGYEEHRKRGSGIQPYNRRIWWLKLHDRPLDPDGPYGQPGLFPAEAVVVSSVDPLVIRMPRSGDIVTHE